MKYRQVGPNKNRGLPQDGHKIRQVERLGHGVTEFTSFAGASAVLH